MKTKIEDSEFEEMAQLEIEGLKERIGKANTKDVPVILQQIAKLKTETEREIYKKQLSKKTGIGVGTLSKDLREYTKTGEEKKPGLTLSANFPGLVDVSINDDDKVVYLIKTIDGIEEATVWEHEGITYSPPLKDKFPFELPRTDEVLKWYEADNDQQLFYDLINYFHRFSYLPYNLWVIVACKVALSYIQDHKDIHYMPELLFYAVPERGKSRTGKAVTYVAYRGIHVIELREANLFRYSQDMKATLFFDIMDVWKKATKNETTDILLSRFEKGAKVSRVIYPERGQFQDMVYYDIYGPTIIATNQPCHKILDTRCIPITMPNKPGNYENATPEKAQELKERLTAWRARVMYKQLPEMQNINGISGRLWDISKPLFQVSMIFCPALILPLKEAIFNVSGQKCEDMKATTEGQIVQHLFDMSADALEAENVYEWKIQTGELLESLNSGKPDQYKLSPQGLGKRIKAIGIKTRKVHGYSEIQLNKNEFEILLIQYGIKDSLLPGETLPNTTKVNNNDNSSRYAGRELFDSDLNAPQTPPEKSLINHDDDGEVERGRELPEGREEKKNAVIEVTEVIE